MKTVLIALAIGTVAGIIDVIPMIIKRLDRSANLSAFAHWVVLGLVIPFVNWNMEPWLKGLLLGELSAIPIIIIIYPKDKKSLIPILLSSAVLGIGIAITGAKIL